jgi:hypothetical protein
MQNVTRHVLVFLQQSCTTHILSFRQGCLSRKGRLCILIQDYTIQKYRSCSFCTVSLARVMGWKRCLQEYMLQWKVRCFEKSDLEVIKVSMVSVGRNGENMNFSAYKSKQGMEKVVWNTEPILRTRVLSYLWAISTNWLAWPWTYLNADQNSLLRQLKTCREHGLQEGRINVWSKTGYL